MNLETHGRKRRRWLVAGNPFAWMILFFALSARLAFALAGHAWNEAPPSTGNVDPALEPFDRLMEDLLKKHQIPGGSLAVAKDGRLVYARGFGYSDVDTRDPARPDSLFRIASISKPLTAVAVLKLAQENKLKLEDPALDYLKDLECSNQFTDPRWREIALLQLLQHRGGWDRDQSFDPMFRSREIADSFGKSPPAPARDVICYMMKQPLDFDPGSRYAYSNFGYCLLGRVIENCANASYEEYLQTNVLAELGIEDMTLARTQLNQRRPKEVRYYDSEGKKLKSIFDEQPVDSPYGAWCIETMDAHGGWLASAPSLVRFACAFDPKDPKLLSRSMVDRMFAKPELTPEEESKSWHYGCGWLVRPVGDKGFNAWHGGSLDGTSTLLVRRHDGLVWAALFNTRDTPGGKAPASLIDPLLHRAANEVVDWPDVDLFQ